MSSCPTNIKTNNATNKDIVDEQNTTLKIYRVSYDTVLKTAIKIYMSKYNNLSIVKKVYDEGYFQGFRTEIMTGEVPDVIAFKPYFSTSLRKLADSGAFLDLNPSISEDTLFLNE